jgi:hypothetical protein
MGMELEEDSDHCKIHLIVLRKFIKTINKMKNKLDQDLRAAYKALENLKLNAKEELRDRQNEVEGAE